MYISIQRQHGDAVIKEQWNPIEGFEGKYEISNLGRVKSLARYHGCLYKSDRILSPGVKQNGYLKVGLYEDYKCKNCYIHRLVLSHFNRKPNKNEECNHKDGNKKNNYIDNLEWCTSSENKIHRSKNLKIHCEEKHEVSKLTVEKVKKIRKMRKLGKSYYEMAKNYDVNASTIRDVCLFNTWKYI